MNTLIKRHPLVSFFVLAFVIAWALWVPAVVVWKVCLTPDDTPWWFMSAAVLGAYAPTVAALVVTAAVGGGPAVRALLRRYVMWRARPCWYLVVCCVPPAALGIAMGIYVLLGHSLGRFDGSRWPLVLAAPLLALPFGSFGEELGWRGFALPALQSRHTALSSAVVLGTIWTFWHLPAYWAPSGTVISGGPVTLASVAFFLVFGIGMCILINWVCNNTGGSVLFAVLFHTVMNAGMLFPLFPDCSDAGVRLVTQLNIVPMLILAAVVIAVFGGRRLVRDRPLRDRPLRDRPLRDRVERTRI